MKNSRSTNSKIEHRLKRHRRVRGRISGTSNRLRLAVYRSNAHITVQAIDDVARITVASATDAKLTKMSKTDKARTVGAEIAKLLKAKKITDVVFDRGGNLYHGRVKAVAQAAREGGLNF